MTTKRSSGSGMGRKRTTFEWVVLLVSLAATLAVVVGLVVSELSGPDGPVDLRVRVIDAGERASGGRPLEVTVENVGGTSAQNVTIEVTVGEVVRELSLDLVAKGDEESAEVVFPADATGPPEAEVLSYTKP
ncbi:MAG: hypothetical protein ACR2L4_04505 [Actinomycetota bacterium]